MNYPIRLTVCALLLSVSRLSAATLYVSLESTNPAPPYTNWATAASVIQDAVDAAAAGDEVVVTNGIYTTGGRAAISNDALNLVVVDHPLVVRSVNGPRVTTISATNASRCVFLATNAILSGFTLTRGCARAFPALARDAVAGRPSSP
jgi:hypothetical protein